VPDSRAPVEPDMAAAEAAPVRPASPAEAIVVSLEDAAEAAPRAMTPTISDLLCDVLDTPDAMLSSRVGDAEEASSSVPPGRIVGGILLGDETIIEPPIIGASGDLVRSVPNPSMWGGPPLAWTSTEGDPYFILDDIEEWEFREEFQVLGQVRVLTSLSRFLVP
jgi:hypothetical protein